MIYCNLMGTAKRQKIWRLGEGWMARRRGVIVGILLAAFAIGTASPALADEVTLRTKDGSFEISGDLIGFDGTMLTVQSNMGVIRIPLNDVTCSGPGCPGGEGDNAAETAEADDIAFAVAPDLPASLLPNLLNAYAGQQGVTVEAETPIGPWVIAGPAGKFRLIATNDADAQGRIFTDDGDRRATGAYRQVIARDTVVAVAGPGNRPASLTLAEISAIFSGGLTNWGELGVRSRPIVPVIPSRDDVIESTLLSAIFGGQGNIAASVSRAENVAGFILSSPGSLALMRGSAKGALRATAIGGECGLTTTADEFGVKSGQYPLIHEVILSFGDGDIPPAVTHFLSFLNDASAQSAISATGLVGLSIIRASADHQADWIASAAKLSEFLGGGNNSSANLQELIQVTANAARLSVTVRYVFE